MVEVGKIKFDENKHTMILDLKQGIEDSITTQESVRLQKLWDDIADIIMHGMINNARGISHE